MLRELTTLTTFFNNRGFLFFRLNGFNFLLCFSR
ncbi:Uncharacterised protein [Vibrio cholerae]|nr:Uncharacterised protein [Vibrio cholerae]